MSVNARAYQQYRNSVVETASPGRLLLMLYNAAIRNLDAAHRAIEDQNTVQANDCLLKAQDILLELMSTLDMEYEMRNNFSVCTLHVPTADTGQC